MKLVLKLDRGQAVALRKAWENSMLGCPINDQRCGKDINKFAKHLLWAASYAVATLPGKHGIYPYAFDARHETEEETWIRCLKPEDVLAQSKDSKAANESK